MPEGAVSKLADAYRCADDRRVLAEAIVERFGAALDRGETFRTFSDRSDVEFDASDQIAAPPWSRTREPRC
jgi:hypothetical protein